MAPSGLKKQEGVRVALTLKKDVEIELSQWTLHQSNAPPERWQDRLQITTNPAGKLLARN
jgi:hypothetical protein